MSIAMSGELFSWLKLETESQDLNKDIRYDKWERKHGHFAIISVGVRAHTRSAIPGNHLLHMIFGSQLLFVAVCLCL